MAGLRLNSLIISVNFTGSQASVVRGVLGNDNYPPYEQETKTSVAIALYLDQQPKDVSKGFVFGSDPTSCDVQLAVTEDIEDTDIGPNHFSVQIDWVSRYPILKSLSTRNLQVQIFRNGKETTRSLSKDTWQILKSGTSVSFPVDPFLRVSLCNPDRRGQQDAYNENLQWYLQNFRMRMPELAHIIVHDAGMAPQAMYCAPSLGGGKYSVIENIGTGDPEYDTNVKLYNAKCEPLEAPVMTRGEFCPPAIGEKPELQYSSIESGKSLKFSGFEELGGPNLVKSQGGRPGRLYVAKHFRRSRKDGQPLPTRIINLLGLIHLNLEEVTDFITATFALIVFVDIFSTQTLHGFLQSNSLRTEDAGFVMAQIFAALAYLHDKEWAHGNLDPRSILIMSRNRLWIKLKDVALSDHVDLGKPDGYHEIYASQKYPSHIYNTCPADIWSAGVVALQLVQQQQEGKDLPDRRQPIQGDWVKELEKLAVTSNQRHRNDATACVTKVLWHDYRERPTAKQVLQERWIMENKGDTSPDNPHYSHFSPTETRNATPEPSDGFEGQRSAGPSGWSGQTGYS